MTGGALVNTDGMSVRHDPWWTGAAVEIPIRDADGRLRTIERGTITGFRSGLALVTWAKDGFVGTYCRDQIGRPGRYSLPCGGIADATGAR